MMGLIQETLKAFASFLCYTYAYVKYSFCISSAGTFLHEINSLLKSIAIRCTMSNCHKNLTAALDRSMTYLVHCSLFKKEKVTDSR